MEVKKNQIYKHFKGNKYKVIAIAKHTETNEKLVIYESLDTLEVYARSLSMFISDIDRDEYKGKRFIYMGEYCE